MTTILILLAHSQKVAFASNSAGPIVRKTNPPVDTPCSLETLTLW
jgi:hypothetical protein